jgi:hypothetical protein
MSIAKLRITFLVIIFLIPFSLSAQTPSPSPLQTGVPNEDATVCREKALTKATKCLENVHANFLQRWIDCTGPDTASDRLSLFLGIFTLFGPPEAELLTGIVEGVITVVGEDKRGMCEEYLGSLIASAQQCLSIAERVFLDCLEQQS